MAKISGATTRKSVHNLLNFRRGQVPVLFAQRVNGGTDKVLGMRQVLGKLRRGKDRGVILADILRQEFPDREVGRETSI